MGDMVIRDVRPADAAVIPAVVRNAFGPSDVLSLVESLLDDPSASPMIALTA